MRPRTANSEPRAADAWGHSIAVCCSLFAVVLTALPFVAHAQAPVRAVSFNIRYGTANDGDHAWPHRRAHVVTAIRDHAPHLLGVQEALRFQLDELAEALPGYREIGVGRDDGRTRGEYAAILVDTARFDVLSDGTFWYSDTPDVPGSMHWGNRITRLATWAQVADRATRETIFLVNTHWDHESQPSRERSAAMLLERIATRSGASDAVIVMGDFNADETNPAYLALLSDSVTPLRDAFRVRHPHAEAVGTFNGFRGDSLGGMIDHVLVDSHWSVVASGIDRRRFGAVHPSDHDLVWTVLRRNR